MPKKYHIFLFTTRLRIYITTLDYIWVRGRIMMFQASGCLIEVTTWSGLTVYRISHLLGEEERKSTISNDELS